MITGKSILQDKLIAQMTRQGCYGYLNKKKWQEEVAELLALRSGSRGPTGNEMPFGRVSFP
jgi:hypothetical protein